MLNPPYRVRHVFSLVFAIVAAFVTWAIFHPGILSVDSWIMYSEAVLGTGFTDEKALLLPLTLAFFVKAGGNLAQFILIQCLVAFLGVRFLILSVSTFWGLPESARDLIAMIVLAVLASPLSVFPIYMATLWLDTWLAIILVWGLGLLLDLQQRGSCPGLGFNVQVFGLLLIISMAILVRLNSLVLYPVFAILLERVLRLGGVRPFVRVLLAACPLIIFLSFSYFQYNILRVAKWHQERTVFALDLASMIAYDPMICEQTPLTACTILAGDYPCDFIVGRGALDCTYDQAAGTVYKPFYLLRNSDRVEAEFRLVASRNPATLLAIKFLNFADYLRPVWYRYYYEKPDNYLFVVGLRPSSLFPGSREVVFQLVDAVSQHRIFRWFSFAHLPWFILNLSGLLVLGSIAFRKNRSAEVLNMGLVLAIPASYYLSYLIALTASDFRFMYPSTLLMQIVALTALASWSASQWLARMRARRAAVLPPASVR